MQLKRLEAYGFKSFADKLTIEFDHGITAIVGPNGSGKSNITDAVRWVLGEQNIRNLRGTRSEDIIFSGSATRRPLNMAEVSLIFDNDGTLPVDFREVAVTRRLYRSGESEYFINRSRCRLKDIYNLFADTGIGHDGMSIIGQNRMEDILNSRPEDRRAFFEETAGITKYRSRKRETVRKLTDTEANLLRVQDIMHEIETQLEPLARHAEKTRQYNELNEEYRRCQLTKLARSAKHEAGRKAANEEKLGRARDEAMALDTSAKQNGAAREAVQKDVLDLEQTMRSGAEANEKLRQRLEAANREMAALEERQGQSAETKKRLEAQRQELQQGLVRSVREIGRLSGEAAEKKAKLAEASEGLASLQQRAEHMQKALTEKKEQSQQAAQKKEQAQAALAAARQKLAVLDRDIENGSEGQQEQQAAIAAAEEQAGQLQKDSAAMQAALMKKEQELQQSVKTQQQARHAQQAVQQKLAALRETQENLRQKTAGTQEKLDILMHMQEEYEGFGKAPRAILQSREEPWHKGVAGAVAELLTIPQDYMTAIEIALGGNQQNIVTEDTETAKAAIAYLKRRRLGRVTFLPLSALSVQYPNDKEKEAEQGEGVIGWANTLVTAAPHCQKAADFLLARILVVDTLDHALDLAKAQHYRLRIVTLGGEFLAPGGSLSGGGRQHREASFLNRSGEIEVLRQKKEQMDKELQKKSAEVKAAAKELVLAEQQQNDALQAVQQQNVGRAELRVSLAKLRESLATQQKTVAELKKAAEKRQASFAAQQNERVLQARTVKELTEALAKSSHELEESLLDLEDVQQDTAALGKCRQESELSRTVLEQEWKRSQEQMELFRQEKARGEQALQEVDRETEKLEADGKASRARLQELEQSAETWQDSFDEAQKKQRRLYEDRMEKLAQGQELETKSRELQRRLGKKREEIHELELQAAKIQMLLADSQQAILREFGLTPERALEEALDLEPQALRSRMHALKKQMDALGPVNPNAVEEYENLQKRHDFMKKQSADLVEAKENIAHILAEMDEAMTKQFREAFADIQRYFGEIFVRLFGGGKAELRLLDAHDVLNSGIDILVTLPQKKRQSLAALSGGERALTVIALLFAFLRYRPSPFSVLDEIDAPLDEANVMRFGRFLREFAEQTQFIVVTHRKGTMEQADTMYGVTVEESGVSKILSVRLDDVE